MNHPARGSYEQSLVEGYAEGRQRLISGVRTPKLALVANNVEPSHEEPPLPMVRATNRLGVFSMQEGNRLGITSIEEIVPYGRRLNRRFAIETLRSFCDEAGVSMADALGSKRSQKLVRARWACWSALVDHGHSQNEIGRVFGYDHTTIRHGVMKHREREAVEV